MTRVAERGVTVAVCCHDSAKVLPVTMEHLARQRVPDGIPWEVLVVDNASRDGTAMVARDVWAEVGGNTPFRVVPEPEPGLVAARNRAAQSARYEFVLYCDDDNRLAPDYVRRVYEVLADAPDVGVLGGRGDAEFEDAEPVWFDRYPQYYATGPQAESSGDVTEGKGFVYGAGFALRRSVWLSVQDEHFESPLGAYERGSNDIEVCYLMRLAGSRIWYDESLRFRHFLPARRLTWPSFLDLVENAHLTGVFLAPYGHVFRSMTDSEGYQRPPRRTWLSRTAARIPQWLRAWAAAKRHRNEFAHPAEVRERQVRGECLGWWTIRGEYPELCDRIEDVRRGLEASSGRSSGRADAAP